MQDLKPILDTNLEYRLKPLKIGIIIEFESEIEKRTTLVIKSEIEIGKNKY